MFLSIVIPIWNDEKYLAECLDSCLNQDIPEDDYEIICVDDGSTDSTPEILRQYARDHQNVKPIFMQRQGGTRGRNTGLMHANGDFVWFVDHDDMVAENILGTFKQVVESTPCDRLVFPCYIFHEQLTPEEIEKREKRELPPDFLTYRGTIWSSILRRRFLLDNDIWPLSKRLEGRKTWGSDGFFIEECRMADAEVAEYKLSPCYFYRVSKSQQTADHSFETNMKRIDGTIDTALAVKELYNQEKQRDGKARDITANVLMNWLHLCMMYLTPMDKKSYKEGMRRAKAAGVFPMRIVPEYTYTCRDCIREHRKKGESLLRSIGYYYSSTRWGHLLYRISFAKLFLARLIKKSKG